MSFKMFCEGPCFKKWLIVFALCSPDHPPLHSLLPKALGTQGSPVKNLCTPGFCVVTILVPQVGALLQGLPHQPVPNGLAKNHPQTQDDPDKQRVATQTR